MNRQTYRQILDREERYVFLYMNWFKYRKIASSIQKIRTLKFQCISWHLKWAEQNIYFLEGHIRPRFIFNPFHLEVHICPCFIFTPFRLVSKWIPMSLITAVYGWIQDGMKLFPSVEGRKLHRAKITLYIQYFVTVKVYYKLTVVWSIVHIHIYF